MEVLYLESAATGFPSSVNSEYGLHSVSFQANQGAGKRRL